MLKTRVKFAEANVNPAIRVVAHLTRVYYAATMDVDARALKER